MNWLCFDCNKNLHKDENNYYMVTNGLWGEYGVGERMLCIKCLEIRLGRKIKVEDMLIEHCLEWNPYFITIINASLKETTT